MTVTRTRSNYEFYKQSIQECNQEAVEDDPAGTYFFPDRKSGDHRSGHIKCFEKREDPDQTEDESRRYLSGRL